MARLDEIKSMTDGPERVEALLRHLVADLDERREHYAYSLPAAALHFPSMPALRVAVTGGGSHFFDKDAIRFWRSKVSDKLHGGRFFVTGEAPDDDEPRRYTVRYVYRHPGNVCLQVDVLGEWRGFATEAEANGLAELAATILGGE